MVHWHIYFRYLLVIEWNILEVYYKKYAIKDQQIKTKEDKRNELS